jgi:hypothetical protein
MWDVKVVAVREVKIGQSQEGLPVQEEFVGKS